jgi:hypothetical protein
MANLTPGDKINKVLRNSSGWLDNDDPFFDQIDGIVQDRVKHSPRVQKELLKYRNRVKIGAGKIEADIKQARQNRFNKYR